MYFYRGKAHTVQFRAVLNYAVWSGHFTVKLVQWQVLHFSIARFASGFGRWHYLGRGRWHYPGRHGNRAGAQPCRWLQGRRTFCSSTGRLQRPSGEVELTHRDVLMSYHDPRIISQHMILRWRELTNRDMLMTFGKCSMKL